MPKRCGAFQVHKTSTTSPRVCAHFQMLLTAFARAKANLPAKQESN